MKILKEDALQEIVDLLKQGAVIAYPTETSYALGCDATNTDAVALVFRIKGRPQGKGTPVIIPTQHDPENYIVLQNNVKDLAAKYWPGPLNIVSKRTDASPISSLCETNNTQSIRKSSHPMATAIANALDRPIVATSANRSGDEAIYDAKIIEQSFAHEPRLTALVDVGILPHTPASTTITSDGVKITVLRQGGIHI